MHVDQPCEDIGCDEPRCPLGYLGLSVCVQRPRMAPKVWRESYGAKGMHAFIDYHRSDIPVYYHHMSSACTCAETVTIDILSVTSLSKLKHVSVYSRTVAKKIACIYYYAIKRDGR